MHPGSSQLERPSIEVCSAARTGRPPSAVPNGREAADFTVRRRLGQHLRIQNRSKLHLLNSRQSLEITSCQIAGWLSTENALSIAFDSRDGRNSEKRLGRYWVVLEVAVTGLPGPAQAAHTFTKSSRLLLRQPRGQQGRRPTPRSSSLFRSVALLSPRARLPALFS